MFGDLLVSSRRRPRKWLELIGSLLAHAVVVAAVVLIPLVLSPPAPEPSAGSFRIFLYYDPPPPPPPPLPRGPGLSSRPVPQAAPTPIPRDTPALVAPSTGPTVTELERDVPSADSAGGDPGGSVSGDPEGMEGGVEGGMVGGIPGGVLGGVIGGTGTGAVPLPVAHPDRMPRPLRMTRPVYPQDAFVKKIEGTVVVEILIDERGHVVRARVLQSVPMLDRAALTAVMSWVFVPALHGGRPVATLAQAPITFRIY